MSCTNLLESAGCSGWPTRARSCQGWFSPPPGSCSASVGVAADRPWSCVLRAELARQQRAATTTMSRRSPKLRCSGWATRARLCLALPAGSWSAWSSCRTRLPPLVLGLSFTARSASAGSQPPASAVPADRWPAISAKAEAEMASALAVKFSQVMFWGLLIFRI